MYFLCTRSTLDPFLQRLTGLKNCKITLMQTFRYKYSILVQLFQKYVLAIFFGQLVMFKQLMPSVHLLLLTRPSA